MYAKLLVHFIRLFFKKKCLFNLSHVLLVFLDLSQILSECTALFTQSLPSTPWNERISNVGQSWASVRPQIMRAVLENEFLRGRVCMVCMEAQGLVKCIHCGMKILCTQCDDEEHKKNPLHDREIFRDGFFKPVPPNVSLDSNGDVITVVCVVFSFFLTTVERTDT